MAGFEGARIPPLGEAVREWKLGRFVPLYAAGIFAGLGLGLTVATWPGGDVAVEDHRPVVAPVVDLAPVFAPPPIQVEVQAPAPSPDMTALYDALASESVLQLPVVVETAPAVEPVAPAVPVAQAPAARPAPVQQPQAPAPAAQAPAPAPAPEKPNFYVPPVSGGGATTLEVNLLNLINQERANAGLAPYVLDAGLTKVARTRSQQLIDQNYFAHRDPYGYSMYVELLRHFGFGSYAWAGENLAMNNWPAETAANEAIRGLMNSPTHRANILAGDFYRIGIGEITAADGRHFFTMIFIG